MSKRLSTGTINSTTYRIVVLLLAESEAEFGVFVICLLELGLEDDHHSVLQEVVECTGVRVETLALDVMDPVFGVR